MAQLVNSYSVVEFPCQEGDGSEIAVVPYIWLKADNEKCYWPDVKSSDRISKMVANRAIPDETWKICDVKRVFGTYGNLLEARKKARRAEDTSDINSDFGKRRRPVPKRLEGDFQAASKPRPKKARVEAFNSSGEDSSDVDNVARTPPSLPMRATIGSFQTPSFSKTNVPIRSASEVRSTSWSLNSSRESIAVGREANQSPSPSQFEQQASAFERKISSDLFGIKTRMTQMETTLSLILTHVSRMSEPQERNILAFKFPLNSLDELKELDEKLEDDTMQKQLVQYFKTLGGSSASDMTRRILRKVMNDDMACQINWKGHNGKLAFEALKISDIIASGVQAFFGSGNAKGNFKVIEETSKDWLKQASNRIKQRSRRQNDLKTASTNHDGTSDSDSGS